MIADKDLISIQEARILLEEAQLAQKKLSEFSQEKLDGIFDAVLEALKPHLQEFAIMSHEETGYGIWQDKLTKNVFVCKQIAKAIKGQQYIGILSRNSETKIMEIGVPVGVIVSAVSSMSPISATIHHVLLALKSGNSIVFSLHPRVAKTMKYVLDIIINVAKNAGLPEKSISYLATISHSGTKALFNHDITSLILLSNVPGMLACVKKLGKPYIYGGTGQGPVFIEKSANLPQAIEDIIASKTFDHGIAPSAENCLILEESIAQKAKALLTKKHAYFLSEKEAEMLADVLFSCGNKRRKETVGLSAIELAKRAQIVVPKETLLLIVDRKYVRINDPYMQELFAPVLTAYIEEDWQNACEKCIELLLVKTHSHTLTIHSHDEYVIEQFALKKPIARLLVNSPAVFGAIGFSTKLFPSLSLGSSLSGLSADNISPEHLTYKRKVAYGMRNANQEVYGVHTRNQKLEEYSEKVAQHYFDSPTQEAQAKNALEKILRDTLFSMKSK